MKHNNAPNQPPTLRFPTDDGHDPFKELFDTARSYLLLCGDAWKNGDRELGDRFGRYGYQLLDEYDQREASAAVDIAWSQFQELLRSSDLVAVEVFRVALEPNSPTLSDRLSGLPLTYVRKVLTGRTDLNGVELEHLTDHSARYSIPMQAGLQYRETHDTTPGTGSLVATVERVPLASVVT